jgi:hypothetical protein
MNGTLKSSAKINDKYAKITSRKTKSMISKAASWQLLSFWAKRLSLKMHKSCVKG